MSKLRLFNAYKSLVWKSATRSFATRDIQNPIVVTDDGSTLVCWHPEKPFPYECTRPIPKSTAIAPSVLKDDHPSVIMKNKSPEVEREELMKMTYTTKHRWFPKNRLKERKTPKDREFL